jgi:phosphopantetheine--protein transferase-like protein
MVGNDIVDLSIAHVGVGQRRIRFMEKLFTIEEIDIIKKSNNEDLFIWLMWSIKESVYKIIVRQERKIRYAPKSIICQDIISLKNNSYSSTAKYKDQTYSTRSIIKSECIHTIAFGNQILYPEIQYGSFNLSSLESNTSSLDETIINTLSNSKNHPTGHIVIQRDNMRIPHVFINGNKIGILSMSHHGKFNGYAYFHKKKKIASPFPDRDSYFQHSYI